MGLDWKLSAWPARILVVFLAASLFVSATPAARADDDAERARREALSGRILPLAKILSILQSRYPGEVLDVDLEYDDGKPRYEIKLLQRNGRILEAKVDARTGRIVDVDEDD